MVKIVKTKVEFEGRFRDEYVMVEGEEIQAWPGSYKGKLVGSPSPRLEAGAKVNGSAKYTHDVYLPGMLYGKFVRSPYSHAKVKHVDLSKALAQPGVVAGYAANNVPKLTGEKQIELFSDEALYQGAEIALLIATDEITLQDAIELVEVEYEPLRPLVDPEESLRLRGSHAIGGKDNLSGGTPRVYERGSVERGFSDADVVIEQEFRTQAAMHNCMETHGSVATWEGDALTVYTSTQSINNVRAELAEKLGIPLRKVRAISTYMGGGFGSKFGGGKYTLAAALASRALGKPVRIVLDRIEENLVTGNRSQTIQKYRIGAKKDGTLTAIQLTSVVNVGLEGWTADIGGPTKMTYRCPNVKVELYGTRTNLVSSTAFRAPGYVEGNFGLECALDELASKLGLDPISLRLKNYADEDQGDKIAYSSKALKEAYERGADIIGWKPGEEPTRRGTKVRAKGMASLIWWGGGGPPAYAQVKINTDGSATVVTASQDIGTGTRTAVGQIAAEELSLPLELVSVQIGDTVTELYSPGSGGSQTLASIGPAVRSAAHDAKSQLLDIASQTLDVAREAIALDSGWIVRKSGEKLSSVADLLDKFGGATVTGKGARGPNDPKHQVNTFGAQFAEVEVDTETGEVEVLKFVSVHDSGRIINPLLLSSQIEGGVIQGMGYALWEGRLVDATSGVSLNANLNDYLVPRSTDIDEIQSEYIEAEDTSNNIGAKGIGEPPIIGVAPAIANAIKAATGIRLRELPLTPERIYRALKKMEDWTSSARYF